MPRLALPALLAVSLVAATACSKPAPAPTPVPKAPAPAPVGRPAPPPRLTGDQTVKLEADFAAARRIIEEARALREEGTRIEQTQGREAANPTLFKARKKYREAVGMTETWIEGELGVVTKAQVDAYLQSWYQERASWIKEDASMGSKLHE